MLRARPPAIVAGDLGGDLAPASAEEIYEIGCDIDEADPAQAEASYRQVLMQAPEHADAHINLGRLLHERGDMAAAEAHYRRALVIRPGDATALFNLGVALEDQGRNSAALEAYASAIEADGRNADAHYNAARLYDLAGDYSAALRHLRICRDLTRTR
jgi:tetratricopeptide (TPR) repeat protein